MAIAEQSTIAPGRRLWTAADVAALPTRLPTGDVNYELIRGELIMMSPTGDSHGDIQNKIAFELTLQGDKRGFGTTRVETGLILSQNPDTLVGPDVMFLASRSMPPRLSREAYWLTIPQLIVEVRSRNDSLRELNDKAKAYLGAGVELAWVADPERKTVTEYRRDAEPIERTVGDVLTAETIIPGFRLALTELFAE